MKTVKEKEYSVTLVDLVSREFLLKHSKNWRGVSIWYSSSFLDMSSGVISSYLPPAWGDHWTAVRRDVQIEKKRHHRHWFARVELLVPPSSLFWTPQHPLSLWTWGWLFPHLLFSNSRERSVWAGKGMHIICVFAESVSLCGEGRDYALSCYDWCKVYSVPLPVFPLKRNWNREKYRWLVIFNRILWTGLEPWSLPSVKLVTLKDAQDASNY